VRVNKRVPVTYEKQHLRSRTAGNWPRGHEYECWCACLIPAAPDPVTKNDAQQTAKAEPRTSVVISYEQALSTVRDRLSQAQIKIAEEVIPLEQACGRVLAEDVTADRDYPPFHRSTRDGYALRFIESHGAPVWLKCLGEARAGSPFSGKVEAGQCVQIMTGAPLPDGADAVAMIEYTRAEGTKIEVQRAVSVHENVVLRGSEAPAGHRVLRRGRRLQAAEIGLLASVGHASVRVFRRPEVAIIATGDEVVPLEQRPEWFQVRNSNAATLAAQVRAAGGLPRALDAAPDQKEALRRLTDEGLKADLLLLSGGISVGKYDLVGQVLHELGGTFYFHGVAIRPGKPLAFGRVRKTFFFGLPGNPVSAFVTFEVFARPAVTMLGGAEFECPIFLRARLGTPHRNKTGLTTFMPARVELAGVDPVVNVVGWQGSGDLVGVAAANCFLVVHPQQTELAAGDWVDVLPR